MFLTNEQTEEHAMFITNKDNYYFVLKGNVDITKLTGCIAHKSQSEMYKYVCDVGGFTLEEVEGHDVTIDVDEMTERSDFGLFYIEEDIYEFINEYLM